VVSWPWQPRGLQIWQPPQAVPAWAYCDLAVCDRFYACACPSQQDAAPAGHAAPRCPSADNAAMDTEWALVREGHCTNVAPFVSSLPAPSQLELQRLRDFAASSLLNEIIARQGVNSFEGAAGRARSAQPVIFVPQESRTAPPARAPSPGVPAQAAAAGPAPEVVPPEPAAEPALSLQEPTAAVFTVPAVPQQLDSVSAAPPAERRAPSTPPPVQNQQARASTPASKSRPGSRQQSRAGSPTPASGAGLPPPSVPAVSPVGRIFPPPSGSPPGGSTSVPPGSSIWSPLQVKTPPPARALPKVSLQPSISAAPSASVPASCPAACFSGRPRDRRRFTSSHGPSIASGR
jgi:hypothetical protein